MNRIPRRTFLKSAAVAGGSLFIVDWKDRLASAAPARRNMGLAISAFPAGAPSVPYIVGMARQEIWGKYGLAIRKEDVIPSLGGGEVMRNLAIGQQLHFGVGSTIAAVSAYMSNVPVQIIASYGGGSIMWIVPTSSPIRSFADLRGKKIGITSPTGTTRAAAILALRAVALVNEAELVVSGSETASWAAVRRGAIDVAWSNTLAAAPLLAAGEARSIGTINDYDPHFPDDFIIAGTQLIQRDPEMVRGFVSGLNESFLFIRRNVNEAAKIYGQFAGVDEKIARQALVLTKPVSYFDPRIKIEYLKATQDVMRLMGMLRTEFDGWNKAINQSFLPPSMRTTIPDRIPFSN